MHFAERAIVPYPSLSLVLRTVEEVRKEELPLQSCNCNAVKASFLNLFLRMIMDCFRSDGAREAKAIENNILRLRLCRVRTCWDIGVTSMLFHFVSVKA